MAEDNLSTASDFNEEAFYCVTDEAAEQEDAVDVKPLPSARILWLKLWLRPSEGWNAMKQSALSPSRLASQVYYPLIALAAISEFAVLIYNPIETGSLAKCIQEATIVFIAFFMSGFAIYPAISLLSSRETSRRFNTDFGRCYTMSLLSSVALIYAIYQSFPFLEAVVAFLPLYSFYIAYQGIEAMNFTGRSVTPWLLTSLAIILLPLGIYELFSMLMPPI